MDLGYVVCSVMWKLQLRVVSVPEISVSGVFTEQWDGKWVGESDHRPLGTPSHRPLKEVKVLAQEYVFWIALRITELAVLSCNCFHSSCNRHYYRRPSPWSSGLLNFVR